MDNDFFFDRINRVWVNFRKTNHKAPVKIILGQKEKAELEQMASTGDTVKNGKIIYLAQEWIKEKIHDYGFWQIRNYNDGRASRGSSRNILYQ